MPQRTLGRSNTGHRTPPTGSRSTPPATAPPSSGPSRPRASGSWSPRPGRAPGAWSGGSRTVSARPATALSAASSAGCREQASGRGAVPVRRSPGRRLLVGGSWPPPGPPAAQRSPTTVAQGRERPARFAAGRGPLPPPAAPPGPAACLLDGLPPRPLHGQGSLRAHECSLGLRPPLDRSGPEAARRYRSPGAGEDLSPPSRQHKEDAMRQFEQDWLELGSRVARSLHYQARRWQREARRRRTP
jgi:hypothetical protein